MDHYQLTYPFPPEALNDLAYYFQDRSLGEYMLAAALWNRKLNGLVERWREFWSGPAEPPQLRLSWTGTDAVTHDSRSGSMQTHRLDAPTATLLEQLDRPTRLDRLPGQRSAAIERELETLRDLGVLLVEGERVMSVVLTSTGVDPMPRPRRTTVGARRLLPVRDL
jgi:hypothetical protein